MISTDKKIRPALHPRRAVNHRRTILYPRDESPHSPRGYCYAVCRMLSLPPALHILLQRMFGRTVLTKCVCEDLRSKPTREMETDDTRTLELEADATRRLSRSSERIAREVRARGSRLSARNEALGRRRRPPSRTSSPCRERRCSLACRSLGEPKCALRPPCVG